MLEECVFGVLEGACSTQAESMVHQGFDSLRLRNKLMVVERMHPPVSSILTPQKHFFLTEWVYVKYLTTNLNNQLKTL